MEYMKISEVSKKYAISTRMLRHYEKVGLIESMHREDYAYRIYDECAIRRLQQIVILRKLQIPLKQIQIILDGDISQAIDILEKHIEEMDSSISVMQRMRQALLSLVEQLQQSSQETFYLQLVNNNTVLEITNELPLSKHQLKEEIVMSEAKEMVKKEDNVRMVLLPPCTVAAYQYIGENPEEKVGDVMDEFIRTNKLYEKKPDARLFGFNHPDPEEGNPVYGYEDWVTIPDDMEVPEPLVKKHFNGGLYAAYTIKFPDFFEWKFLTEWVEKSELYEANFSLREEKNMGGCLEEHLNWVYSSHMGWPENGIDGKLDLLLPVKQKNK